MLPSSVGSDVSSLAALRSSAEYELGFFRSEEFYQNKTELELPSRSIEFYPIE